MNRNSLDGIMREPPKPGRGGLLPGEVIPTREETRLLKYLRDLEYGQVLVEVKGRRPVLVRLVVKDVRLTD